VAKIKIRFFLLSFLFISISIWLVKTDPYLFDFKSMSHFKPDPILDCYRARVSPTSLGSLAETVPVLYRQDSQRRAIFDLPHLNFEISSVWSSSSQVNVGIHGASKASAIADQNFYFVGGDSGQFGAWSRRSGELSWKYIFADAARGVHSTAAIDGDSVYVGSYRGTIYNIDRISGDLIWSRVVGHTIGASPLIVGRNLILAVETYDPDGYLLNLDKSSCEILWKSVNLGEQAHSSPAYDPQYGLVILGANNHTYQAFELETGQRKWISVVSGDVKSTPWIEDGYSYITTWGQEVLKFDNQNGKKIWASELRGKSQVSPLYSKRHDLVFVSDSTGTLYGFQGRDGRKKWEIKNSHPLQISSPVLLRAGTQEKILYACLSKKMCLINFEGKIEKQWPLDGVFTGSIYLVQHPLKSDEWEMPLAFDEGPLVQYRLQLRNK
jgi:outer membrane protein assembly factor BamB